MKENSKHSTSNWVDPDDAPELTPEMLFLGVKMVGDANVSNDEFNSAVKKIKQVDRSLKNLNY